jgi:hypothetical protein
MAALSNSEMRQQKAVPMELQRFMKSALDDLGNINNLNIPNQLRKSKQIMVPK